MCQGRGKNKSRMARARPRRPESAPFARYCHRVIREGPAMSAPHAPVRAQARASARSPAPRAPGRGDAWATALLLAAWCCGVVLAYWDHMPPDLMSTYVAGQLWRAGEPGAIYLGSSGTFPVTPPEWTATLAAQGLSDMPIYPYVYPPLWAVLASALPPEIPPQTAIRAAYAVAALAMGLSAIVALRLAEPPGPRILWFAGLLLASLVAIEGQLALHHCQPQILVGLFLLLAADQARRGAPVAGGAALALAAGLKLYPALLAFWWLADGRRGALAAFLVIGGALGLLSIALAGWPMHLEFLGRLTELRGPILGSHYNLSLENILFQIAHAARLPRDETGEFLSFTAPDPLWLQIAVPAILLAGLGLIAARWRAGDGSWRLRSLFPAAVILVSLGLPLGWAHQFLIAIYLLPALTRLYGLRIGLLVSVALPVLHSAIVLVPFASLPLPVMALPLIGVVSHAGLFLLFALAPGRAGAEGALRPPRARI